MGAKSVDTQTLDEMERLEAERKSAEAEALKSLKFTSGHKRPAIETALLVIAALSLVVCLYLGFKASGDGDTVGFKSAKLMRSRQQQAQQFQHLPMRQMLFSFLSMTWAMAN